MDIEPDFKFREADLMDVLYYVKAMARPSILLPASLANSLLM